MKLIRLAAYAISAFVVATAIKAVAAQRRLRQGAARAVSPRVQPAGGRSSRSKTRAPKRVAPRRTDAQASSMVHARSHAPTVRKDAH